MKKIQFIILLCISTLVLAQEKSNDTFKVRYRVVYDLQYRPDSLNRDFIKDEKMILQIGDSVSTFTSMGNHLRDSLFTSLVNKKVSDGAAFMGGLNLGNYRSKFRYKIIKNYPKKAWLTHNDLIYQTSYAYTEKPHFDWQITTEKDSIMSIPVQKAYVSYGGRNFVAWFASSIPISDGPYKFSGLPGLILELKDDEEDFVFKVESVSEVQDIETLYQFTTTPILKTTRENVEKAYRNFVENPTELLEKMDESYHQKIKENVRRYNNKIEK